eukprot:7034568-Pyramimonas_sp.AAC.1
MVAALAASRRSAGEGPMERVAAASSPAQSEKGEIGAAGGGGADGCAAEGVVAEGCGCAEG